MERGHPGLQLAEGRGRATHGLAGHVRLSGDPGSPRGSRRERPRARHGPRPRRRGSVCARPGPGGRRLGLQQPRRRARDGARGREPGPGRRRALRARRAGRDVAPRPRRPVAGGARHVARPSADRDRPRQLPMGPGADAGRPQGDVHETLVPANNVFLEAAATTERSACSRSSVRSPPRSARPGAVSPARRRARRSRSRRPCSSP